MADAFMERFNALGVKLKVGGSDLGRKVSSNMMTVSGKMRDFFQVPSQALKLVEDATGENLVAPDWSKNIDICDMVNVEQISGQDVARAIKKRLLLRTPNVQLLSFSLLETCVKNCDRMFAEVASEGVLDEMVNAIEDYQTPAVVREKALKLVESWGESTEQLCYLPVFEETYKSLKSRGIRFPGRDDESLAPIFTPPLPASYPPSNRYDPNRNSGDAIARQRNTNTNPGHIKEVLDVARNSAELLSTVLSSSPHQEVLKEELTSVLVEQCRQSVISLQQVIQNVGDNESLLQDVFSVNDELQHVLSKYEEMLATSSTQATLVPALIPIKAREEESAGGGEEVALVRNRATKSVTFRFPEEDNMVVTGKDETIFGRIAGEQSSGAVAK